MDHEMTDEDREWLGFPADGRAELQPEIDRLRARVAELEAQVNEIPDLLLIAHMQGAEQAKDQIQALRAQIESLDCRLVGRVAELSGSHCPADKPCDRCVAERRIEELSHAYAVQGLALEDLTAERDRLRGHFLALEEQIARFRDISVPECNTAWFISRTGHHIARALHSDESALEPAK